MHPLLAVSQFIAQAFVAGLWQGLTLIAAVAILLRLVPRVSAAVRFAVWAFAFGLAAAMPLLHLPAVSVSRPHAASPMVHLGARWGFVIAAMWATFMLARGAQLLMHAVRLRHIWRRAQPVSMEGSMHALLQRSRRRTVEICTSTDVDSPSVIGFFSPRLLIPEWLFAKLAPSDLQQIVLHECEHLRRGDDWINLLQKVGVALFPLNPALLWVDRRLSLERELACDAGVIASTTAPFEYAHCLTRLAEHRLHRRSVALSLSAWSRQSELARRVHHLLRPARSMSPLHARFAIALLCAGLSVGALQMAKAPRLFSFTDPAIPTPIAEAATTVPETALAQSLPVVYRQQAQPRAVMMNAALTVHKPHRAAHKSHRGLPARANVHTTKLSRHPGFILTSLEIRNYDTSPGSGRVATQPIRFSPSYAAVPFGDGWLVIQL